MIGALLKFFGNPAQLFSVVALIIGLGIGTAMTKLVYQGRALRAEKAVSELKLSIESAMRSSAEQNVKVSNEVRGDLSEHKRQISALAGDVRALGRDVRLCTSTSAMRISAASEGAVAIAPDGQPRPADEVLQELTASRFEQADNLAAEHNALVRWFFGIVENQPE